MPNFDFKCKECEEIYTDFVKYDPTDKYKDVVCPKCNSKKKEKLISSTSYKFNQPVGTDKWVSESNGHDYRFKSNLKNVKKQREEGEKLLKGKKAYKEMDDISSGKYFGEVK